MSGTGEKGPAPGSPLHNLLRGVSSQAPAGEFRETPIASVQTEVS